MLTPLLDADEHSPLTRQVVVNLRTAVMHRGMILGSTRFIIQQYGTSSWCYFDLVLLVSAVSVASFPRFSFVLPIAVFNVQRAVSKAPCSQRYIYLPIVIQLLHTFPVRFFRSRSPLSLAAFTHGSHPRSRSSHPHSHPLQ